MSWAGLSGLGLSRVDQNLLMPLDMGCLEMRTAVLQSARLFCKAQGCLAMRKAVWRCARLFCDAQGCFAMRKAVFA